MSNEAKEDLFFPVSPADGYTATKTIPPAPGIHSGAVIEYRPALYSEREAWSKKIVSATGEAKAKIDLDLIRSHVKSLNGRQVPAADWERAKPKFVDRVVDAILGYDPEDERNDLKN